MSPAVLFAAEVDLVETAGIALHQAPGEEHGVTIAQSALRHRPNLIRDQRGLVEHVPGCRGARVLAGKALRVAFFAGLDDDHPGFRPQLGVDDARLNVEPVAGDAELRPVPQCRPGARFELHVGEGEGQLYSAPLPPVGSDLRTAAIRPLSRIGCSWTNPRRAEPAPT
jgi:hypothetical protein